MNNPKNVDHPFNSPAILSLCPGMLGLERGVARVISGIRTVAYVEIEAFVIENLVQQMEQGVLAPAPVHTDVKTFPFEIFRDKIHWIIGGYPCQPFSHAGLRGGADDHRHLWPFISRGIKKSRPVGVYFENVEGHLSLGLRDVLTDLRKLGYQTEVGLYSAAEVGAPHRRNRTFILGLENAYLLGNGRRDITALLTSSSIAIPPEGSGQLANPNNGSINNRSGGYEKNDQGEGIQQWNEDQKSGISNQLGHTKSITEREPANQTDAITDERGTWNESSDPGLADSHRSWQQQQQGLLGESGQWADHGDQSLPGRIPNTNRPRLAQRQVQPTRQEQPTAQRSDRWPAKPGQPQHSWEAPRLESSLGYAVNGYNFREDLLRMAGNAVVEQQAELAFRELLTKFL